MQATPRPALGFRGAVATPNALATASGMAILHRGGNALEAAIAAAATLAVVYPHMNGIGGDNVWLIHAPGDTRALLGIGEAGAAITAEFYRAQGFRGIPSKGPQAVLTVPGAVDGWWEAYRYSRERWGGRLGFADLLRDAIGYAAQGYPISPSQANWLAPNLTDAVRRDAVFAAFRHAFLRADGSLPAAGERQRQPRLAETLHAVATAGRDGFYSGRVARALIADLKEAGGLLTEADLEPPHARWAKPLQLSYRNLTLLNTPPPTQGLTSLMLAGILERFPLADWGDTDPRYLHVMLEAAKQALAVRDRVLGDASAMADDPEAWLAAATLDRLAAAIAPEGPALPPVATGADGGTVVLVVLDEAGRAVCCIQSLYHDFGSAVVSPATGVLWQNRGIGFNLTNPRHPNFLMPGKRPMHTLNAAMALRNQQPYLVYGTMGGDGQPQTQAAVLSRVSDLGQNLLQAVAAPRWLYGRTWGAVHHQVLLEGRFAAAVTERLRQWGHPVQVVAPYDDSMGHAQAILIDTVTGAAAAASDPRSDGAAGVL